MPTYSFINEQTGEEWQEMMSISEMETLLSDNPHIKQQITGCPGIISGYNLKPDNGFRDVLKEIKKKHPKGNVNTW